MIACIALRFMIKCYLCDAFLEYTCLMWWELKIEVKIPLKLKFLFALISCSKYFKWYLEDGGSNDVLHYMRATKVCLHTLSRLVVKALPNPYSYNHTYVQELNPKPLAHMGRVFTTSLVLKHLSSLIHVSHAMDKCYNTHVQVHNIPCAWSWLETQFLLTPWYRLSPISKKGRD